MPSVRLLSRPFTRLAVLGLLAGCATGVLPERGPPIPLDTGTLLDDYVLAHGFAAGLVLTPGIDHATVLHVVELDHAALQALSASAANPGDGTAATRARDAIAALASYAARS